MSLWSRCYHFKLPIKSIIFTITVTHPVNYLICHYGSSSHVIIVIILQKLVIPHIKCSPGASPVIYHIWMKHYFEIKNIKIKNSFKQPNFLINSDLFDLNTKKSQWLNFENSYPKIYKNATKTKTNIKS